MKTISFLLYMTLAPLLLSAQLPVAPNLFMHRYFNQSGQVIESKPDTFEISSALGIDFYTSHFNNQNHTPKHIFDPKYKNRTLVEWQDSTKAKNYQINWNYTFAYDSVSRLTRYAYSACYICAQTPFQITIAYDANNHPTSIKYSHSLLSSKDCYLEYCLVYDQHGILRQVKKYFFGRMEEQYDKM
jgi:hypothetical protein